MAEEQQSRSPEGQSEVTRRPSTGGREDHGGLSEKMQEIATSCTVVRSFLKESKEIG